MTNELEVEDFLAHHGIKGQKWGIRKQQFDRVARVAAGTAKRAALTTGHVIAVTGKATGHGIKKTAIFVHDHPRFSASVAAGAAFAGALLGRKVHNDRVLKEFNLNVDRRLVARRISENILLTQRKKMFDSSFKMNSDRFRKGVDMGVQWRIAHPKFGI